MKQQFEYSYDDISKQSGRMTRNRVAYLLKAAKSRGVRLNRRFYLPVCGHIVIGYTIGNLRIFYTQGMEIRKISNSELADLPETWENPKVDTSIYYQCAFEAWEVDLNTYKAFKNDGSLCQEYNNHFYVA